MRKLKSMLVAVLSVVMILTAVPFTVMGESASDFIDFPMGWSNAAMNKAVENGLLTGYGDGTVRPQDNLTRAQMAAIINRAFGAEHKADIEGKFGDVNSTDWFYDDIAKAVNMQIFAGDDAGDMRPNEPITRQDAIVVLARALVISSMTTDTLASYADSNEIDGYAKALMCVFIDRGYIRGYEDGTLRPKNNITREEFAQIMYNVFADYIHDDGDFTVPESRGEVVLTGRYVEDGDTVRFHDAVIHGDLIIGDGLGTANIIIENVTVEGRILFRGGEGTVTLKNVSLSDLIVTNDVNGTVHFMHYSTEALFTNAVYNTPATFLDREIPAGSASGKGLLNHDTTRVGTNDAKTGKQENKAPSQSYMGTGGSTTGVTCYLVIFKGYIDDKEVEVARYSVRRGSSLSNVGTTKLPTAPACEGYTFKYWVSGGVEFTVDTTITSSMTVTPAYTHTIRFDYNYDGAPDALEFIGIDDGESFASNAAGYVFPTDPIRSGYVFKGWFDDDGNAFDASTDVDWNKTVKAKWVDAYTVSFYNDDALISTTENVERGTILALSDFPATTGFTKTGYHVDGWYYMNGETKVKVTDAGVEINSDTSFYINWVVDVPTTYYTVTFYEADNTTEFVKVENVVPGTALGDKFPTSTPANGGKVFDKWVLENGDEFTRDTIVENNLKVYPTYKTTPVVEKYTVKFYNESALISTINDVVKGTTLTLAEFPSTTGYTKDSYHVDGWYYMNGETKVKVTDAGVEINGDISFYINWVADVPTTYYTVKFYNEGTLISAINNVAKGTTLTLADFPAADIYTKTGYHADGWYYKNGDVKVMVTDAGVEINGDTSFYINWVADVPVPEEEIYVVFYASEFDSGSYDDRILSVSVNNGEYVPADKFTEAESLGGDSLIETGYVDSERIGGEYTHKIRGAWYYKNASGVWTKFDSNVLVTSAMTTDYTIGGKAVKCLDVVNLFSDMKLMVSLQSYLGSVGVIPLDAYYEQDTLAYETILDILYNGRTKVPTALESEYKKLYGKGIKAFGVDYTPIADDGKLNDFDYSARLITLLGEETVDEFTEDAINDTGFDPAYYVSQVAEFKDSLKNKDKFEVRNDNRFVVIGLWKKLQTVTFDEVADRLPEAARKALDKTAVEKIFNDAIDAYKVQVKPAYDKAVAAGDYVGTDYIDTCCGFTVDVADDVIIPELDAAFDKLDDVDNIYYKNNPYIQRIESILSNVESVLKKNGDDYYVLSMTDYYDLMYKLAVLSVDATNYAYDVMGLPEDKVDSYTDTAVKRIGGYLDKLIAKFTFLQNGKVDSARKSGEEFVKKFMAKDTSELWNSKTEVVYPEKAADLYNKLESMLWDKLGFDVNQAVTVKISDDNNTITVTNGTKTVTKTVSQLLKDYADGRVGITVSGTVITEKGHSVDVLSVIEKLTSRFGKNFDIKLERDSSDGFDYKLCVNTDYVALGTFLK